MAYNMIESKHYTTDFFTGHGGGAFDAAQQVLPIVNNLFHPESVIDVGCGVGNWLKVWHEELKVNDFFGVEGPYISKDLLAIPSENVLLTDLKQPLKLGKKFDLAMSLEVAEHLPEDKADVFVESLTSLSDIIMFSASIPGQDGTYHINEQIPEYWAEKFSKMGFVTVDFIRDKIWNNPKVEWWYQQNILLFIRENVLESYPELKPYIKSIKSEGLFRIHPWIYFYNVNQYNKLRTVSGFVKWKLSPLIMKFKSLFKNN